jgi:hypothetical protein
MTITRRQFIWLSAAILLAAMLIRAIALMEMPYQWLEAFNLGRAHNAILIHPLASNVELKKWLSPPFLTLFNPTGTEGPFITRMIHVILSALSVATCIKLGRLFANRRVGLVAGLLYALLPMAVFHERQGLADVLLAAFTTLALLFTVWLARRPRLVPALLLGGALAGAYLTKIAALPYLALPGLAILMFTPRSLRAMGLMALALGMALMLIIIPYEIYMQHNPQEYATLPDALIMQIMIVASGTTSGASGGETLQAYMLRQLGDMADGALHYIGVPLLVVTTLGIVAALRTKHWRGRNIRSAVLFLLVPAVVFIAPLVVSRSDTAARDPFLAARYMLPNMVPLIVITAMGLHVLLAKRRVLYALAVLAMIVPWLVFDASLYGNISRVNLSIVDRHQYVDGEASGEGYDDAAREALAAGRREGHPVHILASGGGLVTSSYLGVRENSVDALDEESRSLMRTIARWLAEGDPVFVLRGNTRNAAPEGVFGMRVERTITSANAGSPVTLDRIIGADAPLADAIYAASVPDPEQMSADYAGIALTPDATLQLAFPGNHAQGIGESVTPLEIGTWPMDAEAAANALGGLDALQDGEWIDVLLVDEAQSDPGRHILLALADRAYRVDESWAGYVHRVGYVTGPDATSLPEIDAMFEGHIRIASGGALDEELLPGSVLRLALTWQASQTIGDAFKVFVHVVSDDGTIHAQYDGEPGAGLFPMTAWEPGVPIVDRFGIRLAGDMPPGVYEIRVGIYHPVSGLRLPVLEASEHGGDYVVIGRLEVGE